MSRLCSLPAELLDMIIAYLAPFDCMHLSTASKHLYDTMSPIEPFDEVDQLIYLCLIPLADQTSALPATEARDLLWSTFWDFLCVSDEGERRCCRSSTHKLQLRLPTQELLEPYFPNKCYPHSTIAWHYFEAISWLAKEECRQECTEWRGLLDWWDPDFEKLVPWAEVGRDARECLKWLESRRQFTYLVRPGDCWGSEPSQPADMESWRCVFTPGYDSLVFVPRDWSGSDDGMD